MFSDGLCGGGVINTEFSAMLWFLRHIFTFPAGEISFFWQILTEKRPEHD
jgi:hypothetical protein